MDGFILVDKTVGLTSARAVSQVKRLLPKGTKVGHAGTLDPFASGLLILLVGTYTRRCEEVMSWPKTYEATIKLGATTATDDTDSPETKVETPSVPPNAMEIERSSRVFVGAISQRPPVYSALKVRGKRASDRVRKGEVIELQPRVVQVHRIEILAYEWPLVDVRIECGRGTYIRSLARDLGEKLGVGGYLTALRRTRIGEFRIEQAVKPSQLSRQNVAVHLRVDESK